MHVGGRSDAADGGRDLRAPAAAPPAPPAPAAAPAAPAAAARGARGGRPPAPAPARAAGAVHAVRPGLSLLPAVAGEGEVYHSLHYTFKPASLVAPRGIVRRLSGRREDPLLVEVQLRRGDEDDDDQDADAAAAGGKPPAAAPSDQKRARVPAESDAGVFEGYFHDGVSSSSAECVFIFDGEEGCRLERLSGSVVGLKFQQGAVKRAIRRVDAEMMKARKREQ